MMLCIMQFLHLLFTVCLSDAGIFLSTLFSYTPMFVPYTDVHFFHLWGKQCFLAGQGKVSLLW